MAATVCVRLSSQQLQIVRLTVAIAAQILHKLAARQDVPGSNFKLDCDRSGAVSTIHYCQRRFAIEWQRVWDEPAKAKSPTTVRLSVRRLSGELVFSGTYEATGWTYDVGRLSPLTLAELWQDIVAPCDCELATAEEAQTLAPDIASLVARELSCAKQQQRGATVMQTLLRIAGWSMAVNSAGPTEFSRLSPKLVAYVRSARVRTFAGWSGLGEFRQIEIDNLILDYRPANSSFAVRERVPLFETQGCLRRLLCCAQRDKSATWQASRDSLLLQADLVRLQPMLALKFPPAPARAFA